MVVTCIGGNKSRIGYFNISSKILLKAISVIGPLKRIRMKNFISGRRERDKKHLKPAVEGIFLIIIKGAFLMNILTYNII